MSTLRTIMNFQWGCILSYKPHAFFSWTFDKFYKNSFKLFPHRHSILYLHPGQIHKVLAWIRIYPLNPSKSYHKLLATIRRWIVLNGISNNTGSCDQLSMPFTLLWVANKLCTNNHVKITVKTITCQQNVISFCKSI